MVRTLILLLSLLFCSCAANGPVTSAVVGGTAAMVAVFDQMLADGDIKPEQYRALTTGLTAIETSVATAKQIAEEAKAGGVSPETMGGGLTATAMAVLALVRVLRGKPSKGQVSTAPPAAPA